ncbi:MAG: esterase family protein, partial [Alistipes sp.]|nr:esterase family protein [Alistipes sp.]
MKRLLLLWVALVAFGEAMAARIDTVAVHSTAMHRELSALVVVPEAAAEKPMPVLYLLHGYGGDAHQWQGITDLRPLAERHGMIIVCPDGEKSWYWDSPLKPEVRFETFVGVELP